MEMWQMITAGAGAALLLVLIVVTAVVTGRRRADRDARTARLRERFGEEYDRVVSEMGRKAGEDELEARREKIVNTDTVTVGPSERSLYTDRWHDIQYRFVDSPRAAVRAADVLLVDVMAERGFPTGKVNDRSAAVALEAPEHAGAFNTAHQLFVEIETDSDGDRTLSDYRDAVLTYRTLFEHFLARPASEADVRVDVTV